MSENAFEAKLLELAQWMSPSFPVGGFAYSHGLEWAIGSGEVRDGASLRSWIADVIRFGAGRTDAILLVQAMNPAGVPAEIGEWALALAGSAERELEAVEQGRAFGATVSALTGEQLGALPYPVAVGTAARRLALPARIVASFFLQAFAANLVSVAVRAVPLGQTEGQRVLAELRPLIHAVAAEAAEAPIEAVGNGAFGAEMAAMAHETMSPRMFKT